MRTNIKQAWQGSALSVVEFLDYREYLGALYGDAKLRTPSYSYLQFAADLGFSRSNVIRLVIVGSRRLTPLTSERLASALELHGLELRYFSTLVRYTNSRRPKEREEFFQELLALKKEFLGTADQQLQLEYFSEWYHPVIREMAGMPAFSSDPATIAGRLYNNLMPRQVAKSLELLSVLGLIAWDEAAGRHVQCSGQDTSDRPVDEMAAVRFHQKMIEIGRESITRIDEARRDINSITVRVSDGTAAKIKAIMFKACEEVLALERENEADADQIYQVNVQLFPFTKPTKAS